MVRIVLVVAGLASGVGIALYVLAWLVLPSDGSEESIWRRSVRDSAGMLMALATLPVTLIIMLASQVLAASFAGKLALPILIAPGALLLIWRNGSESDRAIFRKTADFLRQVSQPATRKRLSSLLIRIAVSVALVALGLVFLLEMGRPSTRSLDPVFGLFLTAAAAVVLFGPWWLRIARDLVLERQARARAEERADMAARVHDSVLQTLALIQRRADQPQQVIQLARAQERELRSWLFEGAGPAGPAETRFAAGIERVQAEVEALHGLTVDTVVVGDCDLDDDLRAMLAAGREALVNAAKWSGATTLSLYGEVTSDKVWVFVRDRGVGFDLGAVGEDRKGIAESIKGRMSRHGGSVDIRSAPGEGTEVALSMAVPTGSRMSGRMNPQMNGQMNDPVKP
jgi:signal transduction histidine kinase